MKFSTSATLFAIAVSGGAAFAPSSSIGRISTTKKTTKLHETVEVTVEAPSEEVAAVQANKEDYKGPVTAEYINSQLEKQLAKLRLKDQTSKQLEKEVSLVEIFCIMIPYDTTTHSALFHLSSH